jgi:hypothetical protein
MKNIGIEVKQDKEWNTENGLNGRTGELDNRIEGTFQNIL